MSLWKKFAVVAAMAIPLALAGCMSPTTQLCPTDGPGIGETSYSEVFNGASGAHKVCTVKASDLQSGEKYSFDNGLLVVEGNVPSHSKISVSNGKMFVTGDVGEGSTIKVKVPEEFSSYTTMMPVMIGKTMTMIPQTHYNFEGFTYSLDADPAVVIDGDLQTDASVTSNHGTHVSGEIANDAEIFTSRSSDYSSTKTGQTDNYYINKTVRQAIPGVS
jgi:hypothetical protein